MNPQERIRHKLAEIQSQSYPRNFADLFARVSLLSETILSSIEIEESQPQGGQPFFQIEETASLLNFCVCESLERGLLQDSIATKRITESRSEAWLVADQLHTQELRAIFLILWIDILQFGIGISHLTEQSHFAGFDAVISICRKYPTIASFPVEYPWKHIRERAKASRCLPVPGFGMNIIDTVSAQANIESDAWGAWIEAQQVSGSESLALLEHCKEQLALSLSFMQFVDTAPWPIKPFLTLSTGDSLTSIMRTLCEGSLAPLPPDDVLRFGSQTSEFCSFSTGFIRKKAYFVRLPPVDFLTSQGHSALVEWRADTIGFVRKHIHEIPTSGHAHSLRVELDFVNEAVLAAKLATRFSKVVEDRAPEVFALLFVEAAGLPHACVLVLGPLIKHLLEVLPKKGERPEH